MSDARAFWDDIIYKDGVLDEEQVHRELADYYNMIENTSKIVWTITDGQMSKPNYLAADVLSVHDEVVEKYLREAAQEALRRVRDGEDVNDLIEEYSE